MVRRRFEHYCVQHKEQPPATVANRLSASVPACEKMIPSAIPLRLVYLISANSCLRHPLSQQMPTLYIYALLYTWSLENLVTQ